MEKLLNHIVYSLCSTKAYSALFKAAVVLVGAALLAMSQTGTFLYEKDLAAHKAKFALEASTKMPMKEIDCSKVGTLQVDCMVAKHEIQTLDSILGLFELVIKTCFLFGVAFAVFSMLGFLLSPFVASPSNDNRANHFRERTRTRPLNTKRTEA